MTLNNGWAGLFVRLNHHTPSCRIGQVEKSVDEANLAAQQRRLGVGEIDGVVFLAALLHLVFSPSAEYVPLWRIEIQHSKKASLKLAL